MKNIEIDDDLYLHIVANTQFIGENASSILRRLLKLNETTQQTVLLEESADKDIIEKPLSDNLVDNESDTGETSDIEALDNNSESVFNFINKEELAMQRGAVGRFLLILAALYRAHPNRFRVVTEICGRDRLYFANSEAELAASGSSTKPKQIPDSPFWVLTNSNTTRKKMMLTKAATSLGYNNVDVEKIRELL
ncbi:replication initiation negative regulator SeqA [Colwellia sp. 20A7]|uniref:replication initiation negative regulator SeqA n=1 Tax=Colwellia sp. 20A7 TaxID=2689569 RepID=UPI001358EEF7|nr:replication initiation negative regulator SeqA [Colwellia sp. 20A7]